jgi:hypothetical protein
MLFAAFFAATRHPWQKGRTSWISFNCYFTVVRIRRLVRFTLGTRAETLQAAGRARHAKLYVDFVSIARRDLDVGQNGSVT